MTGYLNPDGSELVGGRLPGGSGQAFKLDAFGNVLVNTGGSSSLAIAAGVATNTIVKAAPGRLASILVTASGTNALNVFDNSSGASGTQIALVPAGTVPGTQINCQVPALNGITAQGNSNNPGVTIFYS